MTNIGFRLVAVGLFTTFTSHDSYAQSSFKGPVSNLIVAGLEVLAGIKNVVTIIRNSNEAVYSRFASYKNMLVIQTKEAMSYGKIDALISETRFSLTGVVPSAKGVRMHSKGEVLQPEIIEGL